MENKYIFKKTKGKMLNEIIIANSNRYYSMLKNIENTDIRLYFINIISVISIGIYDFYIDVNRTNNVFHSNLNKITQKQIKDIFTLNSMFFLMKILENFEQIGIENIDKNQMILITQSVFKYSKKDRKYFDKFMELSETDSTKCECMIQFIHSFSKKVFSTKVNNQMEFAYISHYLETNFYNFDKGALII